MSKYTIGIDLGGTTAKVGLFTTAGALLEKWEVPTDTSNAGEHILGNLAKAVKDKMQENGITAEQVEGVGVGVPGPVLDSRIVPIVCANLGGWGERNVSIQLSGLLDGIKVLVGNDADVAALGEIWMGCAKGCRSAVMVTLGTGVGGGVIVNGRIIEGAHGAGGEIGHITVNPHETAVCGCGKHGCLEQYSSATGVVRCMQKLLDEMAWLGLIEYNWENLDGKNPNHEKRWTLPQFVPGSAEFVNMRQSQIDEHPEVAAFFERMTFLPLEKVTPMVPPGGAGIGMHVIPVEKAIDATSTSVPIEHIEHWLDKYDGKYAASTCSCRASRRVMGEGCADDPADWCIAVGDMADYVVETDRGHYVTRDEVYDILRQAEDNGFVHQITNIDGENKIFAICNCNVNVCYALRTSQLFNTPNLSRSAYVAKVEKDKCVACGRCVEVCPAGAAKLGQKLCSKKAGGRLPEYPRQELPDATKWDHTKWSPNYRNVNRIETHESGTAPCKTACPAHVAVQGYLKLAAQGRYDEALALIKRENPLPAICGRVCNRRCEDACTRGRVDAAVAIDEVKKFIAQRDLDAATRYVPPVVTPTRAGGFDQKIAIIGAGPAGLSCAFYLAEKGYKPVVFEKNERPGGMLTYGIPSFKLQKDVIEAEVEVIRLMGAEFRYGVEAGRDVTLDELREQGKKVGLLKIRCMRPFPVKEIVEVVKNAKFVGVLEKDVSFGFEGVVYTDVCSALKSAGVEIPAANYVGGLGGRSIYKTDIEKIYEELLAGTAKVGEANFVNLRRDICGA